MTTELATLALWRRAEMSIGRSRAASRVAEQLPSRFATLLRAMEALDAGDRAGITGAASEAEAAGHADVAALLELLVMSPDEIDPTALRRRAKARGIGAGLGVPWLDIYRMLAVWRSNEFAKRPPSLAAQKIERPALSTLCDIVTASSFRPPALAHLSARAEQLVWAIGHLLGEGHVREPCVRQVYGAATVLSLPVERWPDPSSALLLAWAEGQAPWGPAQDDASEALLGAVGPHTAPVLSRLLSRIARDLESGRANLLDGAVPLASLLASKIEPSGVLASQLDALVFRLSALEEEPEPEALSSLWQHRDRLRPAERLSLAAKLAPEPQAVVYLAAMSPDLASCELVATLARGIPQGVFEQELRASGAEPRRAELLRAIYAAGVGQSVIAIDKALSLLAEQPPALMEAAALAFSLFDTLNARRESERPRPERRLALRLVGLLEAFTAHALPPRAWCRLLGSLELTLPDAVGPAVELSVASAGVIDPAVAIVALVLADRAEPAAAERTRMGRILRGLPPDKAEDQALSWIGQMRLLGRGAPALSAYEAPLEALLCRDNSARLLAAIERLQIGAEALSVTDWLLARRSLPGSKPARLCALARFAVPPDIMPPVARMMAEQADTAGVRSVQELILTIMELTKGLSDLSELGMDETDETDDELPW